jgi:hypothetical protein
LRFLGYLRQDTDAFQAAARLAGLEEDLGMKKNSNQYQTAVSILFVGYLLMQSKCHQ